MKFTCFQCLTQTQKFDWKSAATEAVIVRTFGRLEVIVGCVSASSDGDWLLFAKSALESIPHPTSSATLHRFKSLGRLHRTDCQTLPTIPEQSWCRVVRLFALRFFVRSKSEFALQICIC